MELSVSPGLVKTRFQDTSLCLTIDRKGNRQQRWIYTAAVAVLTAVPFLGSWLASGKLGFALEVAGMAFPWYLAMAGIIWWIGRETRFLARLEGGQAQQFLQATVSGEWLWRTRQLTFPFANIETIRFGWRQERKMLWLYLRGRGSQGQDLKARLLVGEVIDQDTFRRWTCRFAQSLGWQGIRSRRQNHLVVEIEIARRVRPGYEPVSTVSASSAASSSGQPAAKPTETFPIEDLSSWAGPYELTLKSGSPTRLALRREASGQAQTLFVAAGKAGLVLLVSAAIIWVALVKQAGWLWIVAGGLVGAGALYRTLKAEYRKSRIDHAVVADQQQGLKISQHGQTRMISVDDIQALEVRGQQWQSYSQETTHQHFACQLWAYTHRDKVFLARTGQTVDDPDTPYRQAGAVAHHLAQFWDVEWKWHGWLAIEGLEELEQPELNTR